MARKRLLIAITLAETGGAQSYVAQHLPALTERYDVVAAAHGQARAPRLNSRAVVIPNAVDVQAMPRAALDGSPTTIVSVGRGSCGR